MGDLAFVGFYSLIIYIESIHVGLGVFFFVCFFWSVRMCSHVHLRSGACQKTFYLRREKNSYSCLVPCHLHPIYLDVSMWVFQAGNGGWEIPPHGGGPRRTLAARFNGRGRGSKVPPGSTFATLPRSCPGRRQSGQSAAL